MEFDSKKKLKKVFKKCKHLAGSTWIGSLTRDEIFLLIENGAKKINGIDDCVLQRYYYGRKMSPRSENERIYDFVPPREWIKWKK